MAVKKVIVQQGQSIDDIAVQHLGDPEGIAALLEDNPGLLDFENTPVPGTVINVDEDKIVNADVVLYLKEKRIVPANSVEAAPIAFSGGFSLGFK